VLRLVIVGTCAISLPTSPHIASTRAITGTARDPFRDWIANLPSSSTKELELAIGCMLHKIYFCIRQNLTIRHLVFRSVEKLTLYMHHALFFIIHSFTFYNMHTRSWNIVPHPKSTAPVPEQGWRTKQKRAHLESHYQTELESVKNKVAQLTDLLKQLLRAKNGEGTSAQPPEGAPVAHIP